MALLRALLPCAEHAKIAHSMLSIQRTGQRRCQRARLPRGLRCNRLRNHLTAVSTTTKAIESKQNAACVVGRKGSFGPARTICCARNEGRFGAVRSQGVPLNWVRPAGSLGRFRSFHVLPSPERRRQRGTIRPAPRWKNKTGRGAHHRAFS